MTPPPIMQLVWPAAAYLTSYVDALKQGWAPNNVPALTLLLDDVRRERLGLTYVELTTEPENVASRRVITANVGQLVEEFVGRRSMVGRPVFDTASTWTRSGSDPACGLDTAALVLRYVRL